ncbi:MAG: GntR family transcriptional regulator [Tractidigestivibacter sp.]|jgi:GntR family transcriptional regulator|uniref:GntR family transcriptional regulator n=1 Tax=Tractidigestivibacter sp. TaxID=2847320 RepID=UPI003D8CCD47
MAASKDKGQPLSDKVVEQLNEKIVNDMEPGDQLPPERELAELYGISRTTLRAALRRLAERGVITRVPGKGAFVASMDGAAVTNLLSIHGFSEQMRQQGKEPTSQILEFVALGSPKHVAAQLEISAGDPVWRIRRLRLADGIPLLVERTYLPRAVFPQLDEEELATRSLYDVLEKRYGREIDVVHQEVFASFPTVDEAERLDISENAPVLRLTMVARDKRGIPLEYTRTVARADQFRYSFTYRR